MAEFGDFDIEIENSKESDIEPFVGVVTTAGSAVTVTPTNTRPIRYATIYSPRKGTTANGFNDIILYSVDGGTTYHTLPRGEEVGIPGIYTNLTIDSNNDGTNYEVKVWS